MSKVEPSELRWRNHSDSGTFRIVIPVKRSWYVIFILSPFVVLWMLANFHLLRQLLHPEPFQILVLLVVLAVLNLVGLMPVLGALWVLFGREVLSITPGSLTTARDLFGLRRSKEYDISEIRSVRASPERFAHQAGPSYLGIPAWTVAIDYGVRTHTVARNLNESEAKLLGELIRQQLAAGRRGV